MSNLLIFLQRRLACLAKHLGELHSRFRSTHEHQRGMASVEFDAEEFDTIVLEDGSSFDACP